MAREATLPWAAGVERSLQAGEILVREGESGSDIFSVVEGTFEILRGPDLACVGLVGAGSTIGEIAALAGCPRTATVRALGPALVRQLDGATCQRALADDAETLDALAAVARERIDRHKAIELVAELLHVDLTTAAEVIDSGELTHLAAGEVLFAEGDDSDAGYLVVNGRLAASRDGEVLGEMGRGEMVGELGLIERGPRSATVTARSVTALSPGSASRRSVPSPPPTRRWCCSSHARSSGGSRDHATTWTGPDRSRSPSPRPSSTPAGPSSSWRTRSPATARVGTSGPRVVDAALGRPGLVESGQSVTRPALSEFLHEVETDHDYLVLETDASATAWTRLALAIADRFVVMLSATPDDEEMRRAAELLRVAPKRIERWLAPVHPAGTARASGTGALADRLEFDRVAPLRHGSSADLNRLARLVSGNATGLVLGGGGARGFAHLGVWRALHELGIEVDTLGGASIGAPLGALMAMEHTPDELEPLVTELFRDLLDYTVPLVSLIKGERISRNIAKTTAGLDLRDLWLPFFCVSTNLTRSQVHVHDRLDAATAIRASVAIPGILPRVPLDGDLLVDGGVLNNLPCDVMRSIGTVRRLIAVDLSPAIGPQAREDFGPSVSGWKALQARLGPGQSKYPGLMAILMRALVAGSVRDRNRLVVDGTVDWYLELELTGIHLLDFERVKEIAAWGYEAARPRLEALAAANP